MEREWPARFLPPELLEPVAYNPGIRGFNCDRGGIFDAAMRETRTVLHKLTPQDREDWLQYDRARNGNSERHAPAGGAG